MAEAFYSLLYNSEGKKIAIPFRSTYASIDTDSLPSDINTELFHPTRRGPFDKYQIHGTQLISQASTDEQQMPTLFLHQEGKSQEVDWKNIHLNPLSLAINYRIPWGQTEIGATLVTSQFVDQHKVEKVGIRPPLIEVRPNNDKPFRVALESNSYETVLLPDTMEIQAIPLLNNLPYELYGEKKVCEVQIAWDKRSGLHIYICDRGDTVTIPREYFAGRGAVSIPLMYYAGEGEYEEGTLVWRDSTRR